MKAGFLFDACALIAFFNDEEGAEKVDQLLRDGTRNQNSFFLFDLLGQNKELDFLWIR